MECKYCGKDFNQKNKLNVWCSTKCRERGNRVSEKSEECKICKLKFKNRNGVLKHISHSHKEWDSKRYYETYYPRYCKQCGEKIEYNFNNYKKLIFCSNKCVGKSLIGNKNNLKYNKEYLINILQEIHEKYKGKVTQQLVRLDGRVAHSTYYNYFDSFINACKEAKVPYQQQKQRIKQTKPVDTLLTVLVDNREKYPYLFKDFEKITLNVGDYKLKEISTGVVIERKSMADLKGCMAQPARFGREMDRARKQGLYVVVLIDCNTEKFMETPNYGRMTNKALYHNAKKFCSIYSDVCQFLFTGGRVKSKNLVYLFCVLSPDSLRGVDVQELYDAGEFHNYYFT